MVILRKSPLRRSTCKRPEMFQRLSQASQMETKCSTNANNNINMIKSSLLFGEKGSEPYAKRECEWKYVFQTCGTLTLTRFETEQWKRLNLILRKYKY
ncbi:unnamed protein product [Caretta caretta]